jgi:hypothetical protein
MAARKRKSGDRPLMDMGGTPPQPADDTKGKDAAGFLGEAAEDDREDARTKHANKGLRSAKDAVSAMAKHVAAGLASDTEDLKLALLSEIADLAAAVRDGSRAAMRACKAETRNLQDATK